METLDIKRGRFKDIEGDNLFKKMEETFGNCHREGDWLVSSFGAMDPIKLKVISKSELVLDITTVKVPDEEVLNSMRKKNQILEFATGFSAKERLKRLKKKAKEGTL
ncbi:MAG: hypothetical protein DRN57_01630 [Thermoplasmata archaeon]|nr:MAG: hypothetical protein DRN57_01630 [Thermoplasmata archaeon]